MKTYDYIKLAFETRRPLFVNALRRTAELHRAYAHLKTGTGTEPARIALSMADDADAIALWLKVPPASKLSVAREVIAFAEASRVLQLPRKDIACAEYIVR